MRMLRRLIVGGVLAVVVLVAGAAVATVLAINAIARKGIEAGATYALGVDTTLGAARVGVFSGEFGLSTLNVASPAGFSAPKFLGLGDAGVAVSLLSLRKDTIAVPRFSLDTVDVYLERKDGKSNYQVILDNLSRLSGPAQPGEPTPGPQGPEKRLVIDELSITNVNIHADLLGLPALPGGGGAITIPVQEIRLTGVGRTGTGVAGSGVTISELASIVVQAVLAAAVENGGGILPEDIAKDLVGRIADLGGLEGLSAQVGGQAMERVEGIASDLGKAVEQKFGTEAGQAVKEAADKAVEEAKKGLEGLLGGEKKK